MVFDEVFGFIAGLASLKDDSRAQHELPLMSGLKSILPQFQHFERKPDSLARRVHGATIRDRKIKGLPMCRDENKRSRGNPSFAALATWRENLFLPSEFGIRATGGRFRSHNPQPTTVLIRSAGGLGLGAFAHLAHNGTPWVGVAGGRGAAVFCYILKGILLGRMMSCLGMGIAYERPTIYFH